jgi:hypothetical protein
MEYIPNAKVSFLEFNAACATKYKYETEATAGGTLYIGTFHLYLPILLVGSFVAEAFRPRETLYGVVSNIAYH